MSPSPSQSAGTPTKPAKAYSCIRCFERKVKCDKEGPPCGNCSKSGVECNFRVPPAPRRRKKRTQEEILKAKLTHYEDILRSKGIDVHKDGINPQDLPDTIPEALERTTLDDTSESTSEVSPAWRSSGSMMPQRAFVHPRLIVDQGRTRFVENNLWTTVAEEFHRPSEAMQESSDDEDDLTVVDDNIDFVLGGTPSSMGVRDMHPLPEQVSTLWQMFLDNVNPLSKLIHVPSLQPAVFEASSHLDRLPKNFEALLFAIYALAVVSLGDDECQSMLGESRVVLMARYRSGTKRALARAKFLGTSDLMVLQAFTLHLLAMRDVYDSKTLWTLTGVGNRIAEGMGVHRDGTSLGLGPFETEMRRRLWWQLIFLDFRTAELTGSGQGNIGKWDVRIPSNINDEDIWPGMKEDPVPRERGTEMIFCLTRFELGQFWKAKLLTKEPSGDFSTLWENFRRLGSIEEKEKGIEELERSLEQKYVRFCDPTNPVEFMAILVTRSAANGMRLMAHHPRRYAKEEDVPETERRLLWTIANKGLEIDSLLHSTRSVMRFKWHTDSYFQWQALIYVLTELREHPLHEQADRGWEIVTEIFKNHPDFVTEMKKPIHLAIGTLCLKAWLSRETTWAQRSVPTPMMKPDFITQLSKVRADKMLKQISVSDVGMNGGYFPPKLPHRESSAASSESQPTTQSFVSHSVSPQVNLSMDIFQMQAQRLAWIQQMQMQNQQQFLPPTLQFPSPTPQQQQYFWWDPTRSGPEAMNSNVDFNIDPLTTDGPDAMDWSQWDFLLKDVRPSG